MKNVTLASASILMLIGTILFASVNSPTAHGASTGTICIIPDGASSCPSSPASITGTVGTQLRVSVFIQNSTGLNGFDITLLADHTILKPARVDFTGTVLIGTPVVVLECLVGVIVSGPACSPADSVDTIHLAATSALGSPLTNTPTTGLLFTAIYNVTGTTSGIPLGFQTGCTHTSVSPNICVTVANGSATPVPEAVQAAVFSTSATPDFVMSAIPSSITMTAGASATSTLIIMSINGFSGTVGLTATASPTTLPVTVSPTGVTLAAGQNVTSTMTISTSSSTPSTTYVVTVSGTSGPSSHVAKVTITVNPAPPPDFAMTVSPNSLTIPAGSSGSSTLAVISLNGFTGNINLAASISPTGPAVSLSASSITLSAGGSGTSTLTLSTTLSTPSGSYTAIVSGVSGTLSHATAVSVTVNAVSKPDFALGPSGVSIGISQGLSTFQLITLTSLGGFSGTVSLTDSSSPAGLTLALSPTSVTLASGATGNSTLTMSTTSSTRPGSYTVTVIGSSGSISHAISFSVTVFSNQPDFTIAANPSSLTVPAGSSATSTINIGAVNGFSSTVLLTTTTSNGLTGSISPTSTGPNGIATLTVTASLAGTYAAMVTGTSGSLSHSATVFVTVTSNAPDFTISANPTILSLGAGTSGTSAISLHGVNGFNNTVFLSVSASNGLAATLSPTSTGPFGTSTLTVTSNTPGSYTAQVTGTSGSLAHTTTVTVTVTSSGVGVVCILPTGATSCSSSPAAITGTPGTQLRVSVFIQGSGGLNGFDITLLANHAILQPAGIDLTGTVLMGTPSIIVKCIGGKLVSGPSCAVGDTLDTIHLAATSAPGSPLTNTPTTGLLFTAIYNVTSTASGISLGFQSGCTNTSVSPNICVTIVNGTATPVPETVQTATFSTGTTPDFVMTVSPSSIAINAGSSATSTLSITSVNGFSGTVSLNTTVVTGNLGVTVSPAIITLAAGQTGTSIITVSAPTSTSPGTYLASIAGISGSLFHTLGISVIVKGPDFSITTNPTSLSISQGSSGTSTLTATSLNGFTGKVTLSASVPAGLTASLTQFSITLSSGGTGTSTLTVAIMSSTPTGTYTVTLTGSSGLILHSSSITVTVTGSNSGDFTLAESPIFQAIPVGSERQTIITLTSVNGFSGNVNLVITPSSSAFACWFTTLTNTATVFVPSGGSANQFPTCGAGRPAGVYNATISGTSGSLSHSVILGVTVTDYSLSASPVSFTVGSSGTSTVTLTSLFGLSGPVSLSVSTPSGLTGTCPSSVTLASGGTSVASCTFSAATPGTYGATIAGAFVCSDCYYNGLDAHSTNITVTVSGTGVPDFSISASPASLTLAPGSSGTSTIIVTSINGFSGTVSLTATHSDGIGAVMNPASITGSGTATLTIGANATGIFSVQVTGTSGTLSHSVSVSVTVASIGVVCIVPSGTTSCPTSPASLNGAVGTQLRVSVFIQGSGGLLGFDVTLLTEHTILKPVRIDLTGSVLVGTPVIVLECVSGVLVSGSTCSATDNVNTIHFAATSALGSPLTNAPTTGLLFTAIYNVTGTTSGIPLAFQNGCANTSVFPGICVTLANGSPTPVPETIQTATFSNSAPVPDFTITASPSSLTVARGSCDTSSTVTVTSIGSFSGTITLTTTLSPAGPTATLSSTTATLSPGGTATIALTVCTAALTPSGSYTIGVTATSGSITHMAIMTLIVPSQAFSVSAIPNDLTIRRGSTNSSIGSSTLTIVSSGFTGTMSISASITPTAPHIPTIKLSSTSVTLSSGGTAQVFLTVAAGKNTSIGSYIVTVTFTSGSITQTVVVRVTVVR